MKKYIIFFFVLLFLGMMGVFYAFDFSKKEEIVLVTHKNATSYFYDADGGFLHPLYDKLMMPLPVGRKTKNTFSIKTPLGTDVFVHLKNNVYELVQQSQVPFTEPKKVAILYMATGKYIAFWDDFYQAMEKYFLPNHKKTYFLFTDHDDLKVPENVIKIHQDQLPWPYITFKRFHFFDGVKEQLKEFDYIYFLNGTMMPLAEINEEIFPTDEQEIAVTIRAGDFRRKHKLWFRYSRNKKSKSYIAPHEGKYYVMGGFNGGTSKGFLKLIDTLKKWTDIDIQNNIVPAWHDESMLNRYVINLFYDGKNPLILMPEYSLYEDETPHRGSEFNSVAKMIVLDKDRRGGRDWFRDKQAQKDALYIPQKRLAVSPDREKEAFELFYEMQHDK